MTDLTQYIFMSNDEWWTYSEEYDCAVPTAKCPAKGIREFNRNRNLITGFIMIGDGSVQPEYDQYISIEKFVKMRESIGYTPQQIKRETRIIYDRKTRREYYINKA